MGEHAGKGGASRHTWRFFRAGGFDQVRLDRGSDLAALASLDQKLWMALACPVEGVRLDPATLALLDSDQDGRIRAPEILAAVHWCCAVLKDPDLLTASRDRLDLDAIDEQSATGARILASARRILANLGHPDASSISVAETSDTARIFSETRFNGDGVIPPDAAADAETAEAIAAIIALVGDAPDRSGKAGLSRAGLDEFTARSAEALDWWSRADGPQLPLGKDSFAAAAALDAVAGKVEDFFTRCRLAAFDPRAALPLSRSEEDFAALAARQLACDDADIAALPLAAIAADAVLPLETGINPAWAAAMERLRCHAVVPFLGERPALSAADWAGLKHRLDEHRTWMAARPAGPVAALERDRLRALAAPECLARIAALMAEDEALAAEALAIDQVDRLVRFVRDLPVLVNNFVNFSAFYTRRGKAVFQAGTLYLDGRSCDLCVPVKDVARHAALAGLGRMFLVYCACTRPGVPPMTIAAALTAGDSDQLIVGRNGVFYDRDGNDWDATVIKTVDHPISIRQAFWAPYKRLARFVGEQLEKFAQARAKAADTKLAETATIPTAATAAKKPPEPFDAGRFAGIFAALGLAVGALGTALASVVTGFLRLPWWQVPLAVAGAVLVVSGPSMVIAAMKLRQRNLAPILDACGWAVNTKARINIPFGTSLTQLARLPKGAERTLADPFAETSRPWGRILLLLAVLAAAGYGAWALGLLRL